MINETGGQDKTVLARFRRQGFPTGGGAPSLFGFTNNDGAGILVNRLVRLLRLPRCWQRCRPEDDGGEITGLLPGTAPACGADHSVVPAASTQGLPIHGTRRVIVLSNRTVARVDLGSAYHTGPPAAGVTRTATVLLDRSRNTMDETPAAREPDGSGQLAVPLAGAE